LGYGLGEKPKTGHWIEEEKGLHITVYKCSECGRTVMDDSGYDVNVDYPFCHCGAKMVEPQESEGKE
jgi:DNA-directed RNA polymerase subunit RPC12/RpoP